MLSRVSRLAPRALSYKTGPVPVPQPTQSDVNQFIGSPALSKIVLSEKSTPVAFGFTTILSLAPLVAGAACTALCPHFGVLLPVLPKIANTTIMYAGLHASMYCGVHWGLATASYDPDATGTPASRNRAQFLLAALGPCFLWTAIASLTMSPYLPVPYLCNFITIAGVYAATLGMDFVYGKKFMLLPRWFPRYKAYVTAVAVLSVCGLAYGCLSFPALTIQKKAEQHVQSLSEIVKVP